MIRSGRRALLISGLIILGLGVAFGQNAQDNNSYLAQKLMLENTLRERISEGLSKVLSGEQFVVDVQAEILFQPSQRVETVYRPKSGTGAQETGTPGTIDHSVETSESEPQSSGESPGMVLPGIPSDIQVEQHPTITKQNTPVSQPADTTKPAAQKSDAEVVSQSVAQSTISLPKIKHLSISVILEEGISPSLLENARQVVKVASHFDRSRGDELSIMTASFRKPTAEPPDEEQVMLQNIASKVDEIQKKQDEAEHKQELQEQRARARVLLQRDSLRLQGLNDELEQLRSQLATQNLQSAARETTQQRASELENQRQQVQSTIQDLQKAITSRDSALAAMQQGMQINPWLVGIALLILILIIVLIVMYALRAQRKNTRQQEEIITQRIMEQQKQTAEPEKKEEPKPAPVRETTADKEEVKSIRQTVVSMSVGQPDAASNILKNWLSQGDYLSEEGEPTDETV